MTTRALAVVLALAAVSCRPQAEAEASTPATTPTSTPTSTPTPTATPTSTPTPPTPTEPAPPPPAPVRSAIAREPGGPNPLSATAETVVDPASTFELELGPRLEDARLVLVDASDAHVAATEVREVGASTRLTLSPERPLVPAARYVLRADGAARREMHDPDGRAYAPIRFPLLVAGEPPPPEPKKPTRRRRR